MHVCGRLRKVRNFFFELIEKTKCGARHKFNCISNGDHAHTGNGIDHFTGIKDHFANRAAFINKFTGTEQKPETPCQSFI